MVAADETVIGCSPSPCFGELVTILSSWSSTLKNCQSQLL
jgi:hypothetical protein